MNVKPRIGYAVRDRNIRLHAPFRYLPIVIVPGFMGSRLTDPKSNDLVWNPLGKPLGDSAGPFKVGYDRLSQISAELEPDETHKDDDKAKVDAVANIKHYYNLIPDLYGKLARDLTALMNLPEVGNYEIKPRVYCCGYDWRLDNARSALRLAEVVEEALGETRERKVILVAHGMGCLVSRYYCRVLGGESKVHTSFLVGSPTLGAPTAYVQLKHGVTGIYAKDLKDDIMSGDTKGAIVEAMQGGSSLLTGISSLAGGHKAADALKSFLGDVYAALCLGAGRYLSRKESTYFIRQIPAFYQLLPSALYCRDNKNWLVFDPLATGHPPTGKMLIFPTLLDAGLELVGGALDMFSGPTTKIGSEFKNSAQSFLAPENAERTSERAKRNAQTLAEKLAEIGTALSSSPMDAITPIKEIFERVEKSFVDCTNNKQLYNDIYTGLLDVVEQRAICAGNLALAYRFDVALTVNARNEPGTSPLKLIENMLGPLLRAWEPLLSSVGGAIASFGGAAAHFLFSPTPTFDFDERQAQRERDRARDRENEEREKREKEKTKPRAYMHPRTVNIYGSSEQVESGCFLLPTNIISNDDSNIVRWEMIPNFIALSLFMLSPGGPHTGSFEGSAFGDGTVPLRSANPGAEAISRELFANHAVQGVSHGDMMVNQDVIDTIKDGMQGLVMDFYKT